MIVQLNYQIGLKNLNILVWVMCGSVHLYLQDKVSKKLVT